jgi:hypothetical protein
MIRVNRVAKVFIITPFFMLGCSAAPEGASDEAAAGTTEEAVRYNGCWGKGPTVYSIEGPSSGVGYEPTKYCHAYTGGTVYGNLQGQYDVGYLNAGNSWFVCQAEGSPNPSVASGAENHWWLWTLGDQAHGEHDGWGWFPANRISGGDPDQRIPGGLPDCLIEQ